MLNALSRDIFLRRGLALAGLLFAAEGFGENSVPVAVAKVQQQGIFRTVTVTGTVTSPRVARLSASISGLVKELRADVGDTVEAGSLLLTLDPELADLQNQAAKARRDQARAALEDARRRLREAESLGPTKAIAKTMILDLKSEVIQDQAALAQAVAEANYQTALLARHELKAPFAGIISQKLSESGEWIAPGQGIFELVASEGLRLEFAVAEDYLAQLRPDTVVPFTLNAFPGKQFAGRVETIVPVSDPGARTFLLRVAIDERPGTIVPGMSAQGTLKIPTRDSGLVVPRDAVLRYPDGRTIIWAVKESDSGPVAVEKRVELGEVFDGLVEVRQGVEPDDRVVVKGNEALQEGQRLHILNQGILDG